MQQKRDSVFSQVFKNCMEYSYPFSARHCHRLVSIAKGIGSIVTSVTRPALDGSRIYSPDLALGVMFIMQAGGEVVRRILELSVKY